DSDLDLERATVRHRQAGQSIPKYLSPDADRIRRPGRQTLAGLLPVFLLGRLQSVPVLTLAHHLVLDQGRQGLLELGPDALGGDARVEHGSEVACIKSQC